MTAEVGKGGGSRVLRLGHHSYNDITVSDNATDLVVFNDNYGFLSSFGDMTLWNILVSCVVLPYISPYSRMTNRMLWGHIRSVAPQTSSMEGGARFHLDTRHHCPDSLVT